MRSPTLPFFRSMKSYFNGEIVGGPMWSPTEGARPTAAAAVRLLGGEKAEWHQGSSDRLLSTEIRLATTSALEHQREPPATGERSLVSGANGVAALFVANRADHRRSSLAGRAYLGPATRASSASIGRSAVAAAHGRAGPCQPLLDRWRTDRLNRSRNQPAARVNSDQCRNRTGNSEISESRHRRTPRHR